MEIGAHASLPLPLKAIAITSAMNAIFAAPLEAGELEFLAQHVMNVFVTDAGHRFSVRLDQDKLHAGNEAAEADMTIEGTVYTFLLLAARKEDADTLFFRRQLKPRAIPSLACMSKTFLMDSSQKPCPIIKPSAPFFAAVL